MSKKLWKYGKTFELPKYIKSFRCSSTKGKYAGIMFWTHVLYGCISSSKCLERIQPLLHAIKQRNLFAWHKYSNRFFFLYKYISSQYKLASTFEKPNFGRHDGRGDVTVPIQMNQDSRQPLMNPLSQLIPTDSRRVWGSFANSKR